MSELINVLVRTSERPNYFRTCINSIREQDYKNVKIHVSVDNEITEKYVSEYENLEVLKVNQIELNDNIVIPKGSSFAPWNLYINELINNVEDGWILLCDDDDKIYKKDSLSIMANNIKSEDDLLWWKTLVPNRIIPSNLNGVPRWSDTAGSGFLFHSKWKHLSDFGCVTGGDFFLLKRLYDTIPNKVIINDILMTTQRKKLGGHGKKDDI